MNPNLAALLNAILGAAATLEASGITNTLTAPGQGKWMAAAGATIAFLNALAHITSPASPGMMSTDLPPPLPRSK